MSSTPNGVGSHGAVAPEIQTEEDKLRRANAILEGRVLKLTHENSHLKQEVSQLSRNMEDLSRRYQHINLEHRMAYQAQQELSARHAKETSDLYAQLHHHQHQAAIFQQQCNQLQHQLQIMSAAAVVAQNPIVGQSSLEASVYVFDKSSQTDIDQESVGISKAQSEKLKELQKSETALRRTLTEKESEIQERNHSIQDLKRQLLDANTSIQKLSFKPLTSSSGTDVVGLPQAVPLADQMVFGALSQMKTSRPIQINLYSEACPLEHAKKQIAWDIFDEFDEVANVVTPGPSDIFTFSNSLPPARWDEDVVTFETVHRSADRNHNNTSSNRRKPNTNESHHHHHNSNNSNHHNSTGGGASGNRSQGGNPRRNGGSNSNRGMPPSY
eukprot:PhF_6_TR4783/c0_g1_i1/m.6597